MEQTGEKIVKALKDMQTDNAKLMKTLWAVNDGVKDTAKSGEKITQLLEKLCDKENQIEKTMFSVLFQLHILTSMGYKNMAESADPDIREFGESGMSAEVKWMGDTIARRHVIRQFEEFFNNYKPGAVNDTPKDFKLSREETKEEE